jgi:CRISPR-associated protein Cas2
MDATTEEPVDDFNRYRVGLSQTAYVPSEREVSDMLRLVAYDIADPKRLRLVAKACQDYGVRVEKSVFECDLDERDFAALWRELNEAIDPEQDAIIAYQICRACVKEAQSMGLLVRPGPVLVYLP